jgi:hypothetical protein
MTRRGDRQFIIMEHRAFYDFSKEFGSWIAVDRQRRIVFVCPANANDSRPSAGEIGAVEYAADPEDFVTAINDFFRMDFDLTPNGALK